MTHSDRSEWSQLSGAPCIDRRGIGVIEFDALLEPFANIYVAAFPASQRRRIAPELRADDGGLPGPSIREFLAWRRAHLDGYFERGALVGIALSIDLGHASLGDYMAKDPARGDLRGLGARMLTDWLATTDSRDQDAVAEIEAPSPSPGAGSQDRGRFERDRIRRLRMFARLGFSALDATYSLPGGRPMLLMVHPKSTRERGSRDHGCFEAGEMDALVASIRSTYVPSPEWPVTEREA